MKVYKSILVSFLAFLMVLSTSGLTMDMHFCKDKLKRVNLFGKAKTCQEVALLMKSCCKKGRSCSLKAVTSCGADGDHKGCCSNQSIEFDTDIDLFHTQIGELVCSLDMDLSSPPQDYLTHLVWFDDYHHFIVHPPPEDYAGCSKRVLYQSFLC